MCFSDCCLCLAVALHKWDWETATWRNEEVLWLWTENLNLGIQPNVESFTCMDFYSFVRNSGKRNCCGRIHILSWLCCTPVLWAIQMAVRAKQDSEFKNNLGYIGKACLKKVKRKKETEGANIDSESINLR